MNATIQKVAITIALTLPAGPALAQGMAATQQMSLNITDSSESAAYTNALMQPTPATKAAMMEAFLQTYPHSAGRYSLLVALLGIYWSIPDPEKTLITAKTILADNPNDLRALMFAVRSEVVMSQKAKASDPKTAARILDDAAEFARRGLSASQPSGMSDLSYQNMKTTATDLFGNVLAMDAEATMDTEGPTPEPTQSAQAKVEPSAEEPGFVPEKTETIRSPRKTVATRSKAPAMKPGPPSASKSVAAAEREECHPVNQDILVTTRSLTGPAECHGETEATLTNRLKDTVECEVVFHQNGIFEPRTASKIEIAPGQTIQANWKVCSLAIPTMPPCSESVIAQPRSRQEAVGSTPKLTGMQKPQQPPHDTPPRQPPWRLAATSESIDFLFRPIRRKPCHPCQPEKRISPVGTFEISPDFSSGFFQTFNYP